MTSHTAAAEYSHLERQVALALGNIEREMCGLPPAEDIFGLHWSNSLVKARRLCRIFRIEQTPTPDITREGNTKRVAHRKHVAHRAAVEAGYASLPGHTGAK